MNKVMGVNYTDKNGRGWKFGDKWEYHNVIYTIVGDGDTGLIYLKHPSSAATFDDHIDLKDLSEGEII